MKYRQFGKTKSKVSEVGMGCWAIGGSAFGNSYGPTDDAESIKAVKKAAELGCTFFDTADVYGHGHSEELLGLALQKIRSSVMIATKAGGSYIYGQGAAIVQDSEEHGSSRMYNNESWGHINFSQEYINFAVEQSLHRLRTNYIDVYQLHNPPLRMIQEGEVFKPLRELQKQGKIRHVGVSVFTLDEGIAALEHADSVQCVFNMLDPRNYELMETAKRRGAAIIVREPLANGFLSGKYNGKSTFDKSDIRSRMPQEYIEEMTELVQEMKKKFAQRQATMAQIALRYVLAFDCVTSVIPGAKTAEQAEENMRTSEIAPLTEEEMNFLGS